MLSRNKKNTLLALTSLMLWAAPQANATVTINVTTTDDEQNCYAAAGSGAVPCANPSSPNNFPASTGCSLREAISVIDAQSNTNFPECTAPELGSSADNVIDLGGQTIVLNGAVPDPAQLASTGATDYSGTMPDIFSSASIGKVTVQNGTLQCFSDPISGTGIRMFRVVSGDLTLKDLAANTCTADVPGIVITNDSGNTTLTNVTIGGPGAGIKSLNSGDGGCIAHGSGNINITNSNFTACEIDDGNTGGNGGALHIGAVGFSTNAAITNTTFTSNIARTSGGAIHLSNTDAISIVNATFTTNVAKGNTFDAANAELGGGAIYATGTADDGRSPPDVPSHFLVMSTLFTANTAPNGTGGAILLSAGDLRAATVPLPAPPWIIPPAGPVADVTTIPIPGGVFNSHFIGNLAGGTWNGTPVEKRAGAGGAIYSSGNLDMLDSSVVGNNSSSSSGGGIAQYGTSSRSAKLFNVTISGNSAAVAGGGVANLENSTATFSPLMEMRNVTIAGNAAPTGGAFYNGALFQADVVVRNTIFDAGGSGGTCVGSAFTDEAVGNVQNPGTACGATMLVGDPKLQAPLPGGGANFVVLVMQLNDGSAASGAGDNTVCSASPIYDLDAALNSRPAGLANCDAGAFESGTTTPVQLQSFSVD